MYLSNHLSVYLTIYLSLCISLSMCFSLYTSIYRFVFSTDPVIIQYSIFQLPCRNLLALISISLISEVVFQVTVQLPFHLKRYESDPFIHGALSLSCICIQKAITVFDFVCYDLLIALCIMDNHGHSQKIWKQEL